MGKIIGKNVVSTFTNAVDLTVGNSIFISGSQSVWSDVNVSGSNCIQCFVVPCVVSANPPNNGTLVGGLTTTTSSIWWDTGFKASDCPQIKIAFLPLSGSVFNDVNASKKDTGFGYGIISCLTASTAFLNDPDLETSWTYHRLAYYNVNDPGSGYGSKHHKLEIGCESTAGGNFDGTNSNGPVLRSELVCTTLPETGSNVTRLGPIFMNLRVEGGFGQKGVQTNNQEMGSNEDRIYIFATAKRLTLSSVGGGSADDFRLRFKLRASIEAMPKKTILGQT